MNLFIALFSILLPSLFTSSAGGDKTVSYIDFGEFTYSVETRSDSVFLMVNIVSHNEGIRDDARLLIKLADGEVIDLRGRRLENSVVGLASGGDGDSDTLYERLSMLYHCSAAEFYIKKTDIEKFKNGIVKIRINTLPKIHTKEWKKDKIGKPLYDLYAGSSPDSFGDEF